jgi:EmrB/QacA subfamily drug resistance transporter
MLVPLIVACGLFMENLDSTVLSTALPSVARSFGENPVHLNLALSSYLFSLAVFIPISGWVADRFGARQVFRAAIVIFTIGSIFCGLSQSLWQLVVARALQGLGGAIMTPVGRLTVLRSVPRHEFVRAMTYVTIPALVGPIVGPPVGGFITTYFSWRWIFWINVPIGILGVVLVTLFIENLREEPPPFDWPGFALSGLGLTGLVVGFETVARGLLPDSIVAMSFAAGAMMIVLYILHAHRRSYPAVNLSLLKIPTFRAGVIGGFLFRIGIGAIPFLLPLMLQVCFGLSPFHSGLLTLASAVGALFMKTIAVKVLRQFGFRQVLLVNAIFSSSLLALYGLLQPWTPHVFILALLVTAGFFRSLQFTSINALTYADIPRERMSQATSFASMQQQLSLSVGVGTGALLLHAAMNGHSQSVLTTADFSMSFFALGLISALSIFAFLPLPRHAGAEVSGQRHRAPVTSPFPRPGE